MCAVPSLFVSLRSLSSVVWGSEHLKHTLQTHRSQCMLMEASISGSTRPPALAARCSVRGIPQSTQIASQRRRTAVGRQRPRRVPPGMPPGGVRTRRRRRRGAGRVAVRRGGCRGGSCRWARRDVLAWWLARASVAGCVGRGGDRRCLEIESAHVPGRSRATYAYGRVSRPRPLHLQPPKRSRRVSVAPRTSRSPQRPAARRGPRRPIG